MNSEQDLEARNREDMCPGALRPWPADDGLLVRVRIPGGQLPTSSLAALAEVSRNHGDGDLHLTSRANLQLRGLPADGEELPREVLDALVATGLFPSLQHDLVRNIMMSPASGLGGGRADLRPVVTALDELLRDSNRLSELPGRFLFVLDDGRGDLIARTCDLGLVALDDTTCQMRVGSEYGQVLEIEYAADSLARHAHAFMAARGTGENAPWHVSELAAPLIVAGSAEEELPQPADPMPYGAVEGGNHVGVADGVLTQGQVEELLDTGSEHFVVTPWQGVLVPGAAA